MDYDLICEICGGELGELGKLGSLVWHVCRNCGMQFCSPADQNPEEELHVSGEES